MGTNFRSSANAPVTLCWRQRSRELVTVHGFRESGTGNRRMPVTWLPDNGSSSPDVRSSDVKSHSSSEPNSITTRDEDESSFVSFKICCVCWFFSILRTPWSACELNNNISLRYVIIRIIINIELGFWCILYCFPKLAVWYSYCHKFVLCTFEREQECLIFRNFYRSFLWFLGYLSRYPIFIENRFIQS